MRTHDLGQLKTRWLGYSASTLLRYFFTSADVEDNRLRGSCSAGGRDILPGILRSQGPSKAGLSKVSLNENDNPPASKGPRADNTEHTAKDSEVIRASTISEACEQDYHAVKAEKLLKRRALSYDKLRTQPKAARDPEHHTTKVVSLALLEY
ncbi:uncharacterized protein BDZ83DRAFT_658069 [Colletotrichum acutatum]|uniref:Uncharacterized protein n=1 Tax=Glomerella acutata TaxID=27357 RepID=A0AAD8U9Z9_GLOAC|nr:uncharacterized protein BDZ83DRAFT_658069 [Colletotrichum acutatum]KAK1705625.1 hypothetical protein BDZ83DRAFT_658069 [Colletotrichum acutatum]